jgi:hypothetical protein
MRPRAKRRLDLRPVYAIMIAVLSVLAVLVWIALQRLFDD